MSQKYPIPHPDRIVSLSCIVVGVGLGGSTSMLAHVTVVDYRGETIYTTYVQPTMPVTDYRTSTTGIEPHFLQAEHGALRFSDVQATIASHIRGKVIVGHSLWNDLSVLGIAHPAVATRDVALYQPYRNALRSPNQVAGLPTLMWHLMGRKCQVHKLCSAENSRATMDLYRSHATEWEGTISTGHWPSHLPPSTFSRCYT